MLLNKEYLTALAFPIWGHQVMFKYFGESARSTYNSKVMVHKTL